MVLTEHLTDYTRGFFCLSAKIQPQTVHSEKDSSLNRLQTVPDIRKGTGHDNRHRIVDVRGTHLVIDLHRLDYALGCLFKKFCCIVLICHNPLTVISSGNDTPDRPI